MLGRGGATIWLQLNLCAAAVFFNLNAFQSNKANFLTTTQGDAKDTGEENNTARTPL